MNNKSGSFAGNQNTNPQPTSADTASSGGKENADVPLVIQKGDSLHFAGIDTRCNDYPKGWGQQYGGLDTLDSDGDVVIGSR